MSRNRLRDPQLIHGDFLRGEMDAVTAADVLAKQSESLVFSRSARKQTVSGKWDTGETQRELLTALVDTGIAQDDTELGDLAEFGSFGPAPTVAAGTAAGTTATAAISSGNDSVFTIEVVPGGTGIAAGAIATITFAIERGTNIYNVQITPASGPAATLGGVVRRSSRTTTTLQLSTAAALTSGSTYQWDVVVTDMEY